jgi:hypothetical protein
MQARTVIIARRAILWVAVVALVLGAFLLWDELPLGQGQTPDVIDLTGEVEASNCAPCHLRIAEAQVPGLVFTHGNHLMVSCTACHYEEPHKDGVTNRPPMDSCFNCHGIQHGSQGSLATDACEDCHTPSFDLRPATHTEDWAEKPHAEAGEGDVNRCMMCHEAPIDCDPCHEDEDVDVGPMPGQYLAILPGQPAPPVVEVYPKERVTMGQCVYCHPDVDDFMPGSVIFAHDDHLRRNYQCDVCHTEFAHENEEIMRPDMQGCYRCHGLVHASNGEVATEECEACHPAGFELVPDNHTDAFVAGDHKHMVAEDPAYCSMCHTEEFCIECHTGQKTRPDGTPIPAVVPADHKVVEWYGEHGKLFLDQEGQCGACNTSDSCKECHQTPMPHPTDWLEGHGGGTPEDYADCDLCHQDRTECQNCHHDSVKRGELTAENCEPCHDEMQYEPATEIPNKAFAEHAVHFDVAEVKGEPYKCYECHVSFGQSAVERQAEILQGHDLRLCYECHGALDIYDKQIAPYPGAELCRQCHTDINI